MSKSPAPGASDEHEKPKRGHDRAALTPKILLAISEGMTVTEACKLHGITRKTLNEWALEDAALGAAYARAREQQAHALAEECLAIADEPVASSEQAQRNRLRVDTRKWYTSKIAPKMYGEKLDVTSDGKALAGVVVLPPPAE